MPYIGRDLNRGNYLKLDDISSSFNGNTKTFNLTSGGTAFIPGSSLSILVSVGGVILEPETAYQINNSEITFTTAPSGSDNFFCIVLGVALGVNTVADGTVNGAQVAKPFNYDDYFHLDSTNNRVGISSSIPSVALDVNGTVKSSVFKGPIHNTSGLSTFYDLRVTNDLTVEGTTTTLDTNLIGVDRVEVGANSDSIVGVAITQSGSADIVNLFDGTTEVLTVKDGGKIGIGIENPTGIFDIREDNNPQFTLRAASHADDGGGRLNFAVGVSAAPVDGNTMCSIASTIHSTSGGTLKGDMKFYTNGGDNLVQRMVIDSSGKVRIANTDLTTNSSADDLIVGTTSGNRGLTIFSGTGNTGNIFFADTSTTGVGNRMGTITYDHSENYMRFSTSGNQEKVRILSDGEVGIGITNPTDRFHVYHATDNFVARFESGDAGGGIVLKDNTHATTLLSTDGAFEIDVDNGNDIGSGESLEFKISGATKLTINDGNVQIPTKLGINGAAPQSPLDVIANSSGYAVDIRGRSTDDTSEIHFCGNNSSPNYAVVGVTTTGGGILNVQVAGTQRLKIENGGNITNTGIETSFVTTVFGSNFAKLDLRGTNISNSNHYILSYGAGHANDQEFHMVNTLGDLVFRTGTGTNTQRLRIDSDGLMANNGRVPSSYGSPNLLVSGTNSMFTMMGDGSINNSSYTGIKFRVAGGSTGDYTKAGIFVVRQSGYNDLDMLFCFNKDANATGVSDGDEKVRINSDGRVGIGTNPAEEFHLYGNSAIVALIESTGENDSRVRIKAPNDRISYLEFADPDDADAGEIRYDHSNDYMGFHVNGNVEKLRITSDDCASFGNSSPPAWQTGGGYYNLQLGNSAYFRADTDDSSNFLSYGVNAYRDSSGWKFKENGRATQVSHQSGEIFFNVSNSGNAGNAITFSEALRITSDGNVGINEDKPQTALNVRGTISTGRNVAREVGTVVDYSGQHSGTRSASNVINGKKNYENGSNDWLAPNGQRDNAYVTIDLQAQYNINRIVIYNQNEYNTSRREVKRFTLETSNDNATWTTVLDDECGKSNAHEPNPGWSFRIPGSYRDDVEYLNARYWKFTMKDFHGVDGYGGIMEIELYQEGGDGVIDEVTSGSVVAGDVYAETGAFRRLTHNGAPNTGHDASGSNGVESGLSIGLDGNRTFLAIGMNGESNLPIIYKTYRINAPGENLSATHVLMEATNSTNSIVMNGTLTIFPGRAGYNQQRGYIQYGINYSAYNGSLYGDHYELHRQGVTGFTNLAIVKSGLKVQLEVTSNTAAVGRIMMIWQGQLLGHTHN